MIQSIITDFVKIYIYVADWKRLISPNLLHVEDTELFFILKEKVRYYTLLWEPVFYCRVGLEGGKEGGGADMFCRRWHLCFRLLWLLS
jgi:hypothetical protein